MTGVVPEKFVAPLISFLIVICIIIKVYKKEKGPSVTFSDIFKILIGFSFMAFIGGLLVCFSSETRPTSPIEYIFIILIGSIIGGWILRRGKKQIPIITNGMTKREVIAKLGEPAAQSDFNDVLSMVKGAVISSDIYEQAKSAELFIFQTSFGEYSIRFDDGRVVDVNFIPK